jgi:hypothetical protein
MDVKLIVFGETGLDKIVQWLRSNGEPQNIEQVLEQYLKLLKELVVEEKE